jgi:hypothetical protein
MSNDVLRYIKGIGYEPQNNDPAPLIQNEPPEHREETADLSRTLAGQPYVDDYVRSPREAGSIKNGGVHG